MAREHYDPPVERRCLYRPCRKRFSTKAAEVRKGQGRFCSKSCAAKSRPGPIRRAAEPSVQVTMMRHVGPPVPAGTVPTPVRYRSDGDWRPDRPCAACGGRLWLIPADSPLDDDRAECGLCNRVAWLVRNRRPEPLPRIGPARTGRPKKSEVAS